MCVHQPYRYVWMVYTSVEVVYTRFEMVCVYCVQVHRKGVHV